MVCDSRADRRGMQRVRAAHRRDHGDARTGAAAVSQSTIRIVAGRDAEVESVVGSGAVAATPGEDGMRDFGPVAQSLELQILTPLGAPLDHPSPPASSAPWPFTLHRHDLRKDSTASYWRATSRG